MITMKNIIREGHPTLKQKSEAVPLPLDKSTKDTLKAMREFLINSQDEAMAEQYSLRPGVGLAAPQINIKKRLIAIRTEDELYEKFHDYLMINPTILSHTEARTYMPGGEGCLSVDREVDGLVPRYKRVSVKTHLYDVDTDQVIEKTLRLRGFLSIVFQHELDHLNGVLFVDKTQPTLEGIEPIQFAKKEQENNKEEL